MKASHPYTPTMPILQFKVVEQECLDLFNHLANKEENLTKEDFDNIKTFQYKNVSWKPLPIRHTILDLESVILLRQCYKNGETKHVFTGEEWFLNENPFKKK